MNQNTTTTTTPTTSTTTTTDLIEQAPAAILPPRVNPLIIPQGGDSSNGGGGITNTNYGYTSPYAQSNTVQGPMTKDQFESFLTDDRMKEQLKKKIKMVWEVFLIKLISLEIVLI